MENVIVKMCGFMREEDVDAGIRQSVDICIRASGRASKITPITPMGQVERVRVISAH